MVDEIPMTPVKYRKPWESSALGGAHARATKPGKFGDYRIKKGLLRSRCLGGSGAKLVKHSMVKRSIGAKHGQTLRRDTRCSAWELGGAVRGKQHHDIEVNYAGNLFTQACGERGSEPARGGDQANEHGRGCGRKY
eukprot:1268189-Pleurochrysis_carterae.AAC.1